VDVVKVRGFFVSCDTSDFVKINLPNHYERRHVSLDNLLSRFLCNLLATIVFKVDVFQIFLRKAFRPGTYAAVTSLSHALGVKKADAHHTKCCTAEHFPINILRKCKCGCTHKCAQYGRKSHSALHHALPVP